jgi:hypothetical protein
MVINGNFILCNGEDMFYLAFWSLENANGKFKLLILLTSENSMHSLACL